MKFKKIVGFGDSWMYGDELLDPDLVAVDPTAHSCYTQNDAYRLSHCFLGLLGKHYGVPIENFGVPGGSLQSSIWTLIWWLEHEESPKDCLVLVGHTGPRRTSFYDPDHVSYGEDPPWNRFMHSKWIDADDEIMPKPWKSLFKQWITLSDSDATAILNYKQAALTFDGISARRGFCLCQFNIEPQLTSNNLPSMLWPDRAIIESFCDRLDLLATNKHPNENGHELIRDLLIPEIDRLF